jgi:phosphinothricin acetyltransferase
MPVPVVGYLRCMSNVRAATADDLPGILEIYNHVVLHSTATADLEPLTLEARRRWFDDHAAAGLPIWVAELDGRVAGFAALNRHRERPGYRFTVENSVYVAEASRGRGVGRALLEETVRKARELGLHTILAGISGDNAASLALHARFGFVEAARFKEAVYKFNHWIDVIYLQLLL